MSSQLASFQGEQSGPQLSDVGTMLQPNAGEYFEPEADTSSVASANIGEWATVEETLTPYVILETCTAQLGALTTLIGLYNSTDLSSLEERVR